MICCVDLCLQLLLTSSTRKSSSQRTIAAFCSLMALIAIKVALSQGFQEELSFRSTRVAVMCQLSAPVVSIFYTDGIVSRWLILLSSLAGVGVGACCGTDCTNIGAFPGAPTMKRDKLPQPPSRVMRSVVTSNTRPLSIGDSDEYRALQGRSNVEEAQTRPLSIGDSDEHRALQARKIAEETQNTRPLSIGDHPLDERKLAQRATGGQHPNPWGGQPAPPAPKWNVSHLNPVCMPNMAF